MAKSEDWAPSKDRDHAASGRLYSHAEAQARVGSSASEAFIKRLVERCFRCLALDHQVAQCRDPVHYLACKGVGHILRSWPPALLVVRARVYNFGEISPKFSKYRLFR